MPDSRRGIQHLPAPPPHDYLNRVRLYDILNLGRRVTVVRAEGGAGKTTLVGTWITHGRHADNIMWITIDPNRRSRLSFFQRFAESILDSGIVAHDSALERIATGEKTPPDAATTIADAFNTLSNPPLLVIDDLHLLDSDASEDLGYVIEQSPGLRFIGLTRVPTTIDTGIRALKLGTHIISSTQMALTPAELQQLSNTFDCELSEQEIEAVHKVTSGNLLASRIALSTLRQESSEQPAANRAMDSMERVDQAVHESLRPAFASDADYRQALALSLVPIVDRSIAEEIIGSSNALNLLENLARQGLGTFSSEGSRVTFSFHAVARATLSNRAEKELAAQDIALIRLSAALLMEEWGDPVTVIELFLTANAYEYVWPFFIKEFSVLTSYRIDDLIRLLPAIPDSVLKEHPALAAVLAISLSERESRPSRRVRQLADWVLASTPQLAGSGAAEEFLDLTTRLGVYRATREYTRAADVCVELVERLQHMTPAELTTIGTRSYPVALQIVLTDVLDGRLDDALVHGELLSGDTHEGRALHGISLAAYSHALMGRIPAAITKLSSLPEKLPNNWARSIGAVGWNMTNALVAVEEGDTSRAQKALIPLEARPSSFEHWAILAWVEGLISLVEGDFTAGYEDYTQLVDASAGRSASHWANVNYRAMHADLAHAAGDISRAEDILGKAPEGTATSLAKARLELTAGRSASALDFVLSTRHRSHTLRQAAEGWLLAAVASLRLGTKEQATRHVKRAIRIMSRNALRSPLALVPYEEISCLLESHDVTIPLNMAQPFKQRVRTALTQREQLVLRKLTTNATLTEIANELFVSRNTIKSQLRSIYRKLEVSGRDEAVAMAAELRLL